MFNIDPVSVRQWRHEGEHWVPVSVSAVCPHCAARVTFALDRFQFNQHCASFSSTANCPSCSQQASFWIIEPTNHRKTDNKEAKAVCMYPIPRLQKELQLADMDEVAAPVQEDYRSAVNVFNIGEWNATAVCCRRVMEGLMHHLLPEELHARPLFEQLAKLPEHHDLAKPLLTLADAVRKGGNLGAHFDPTNKPDFSPQNSCWSSSSTCSSTSMLCHTGLTH